MKRWAYGTMRDGMFLTVPILRDGSPAAQDNNNGFDAVLLGRPDFTLAVLTVPRLAERELRQVIRYRIRSVYPGNPDETAFEYELSPDRSTAFVTVVRADVLSAVRTAAGERPLFLPHHLLRAAGVPGRNGRHIAVFLFDRWMELLSFENGRPVESVQRSRESIEHDLELIAAFTATATPGTRLTLAASETETEALAGAVRREPVSALELSIVPIPALLRSAERAKDTAFRTERPVRLPRFGVRIAILAVCTALAAFGYLRAKLAADEALLARLGQEHAALERLAHETALRSQELEALGRRAAVYSRTVPSDIYGLLTGLRDALGENVLLTSISVRSRSFQCEGRAVEPFSLVERFSSMPELFSDINVIRVSPIAGTAEERFVLTGTYHGE